MNPTTTKGRCEGTLEDFYRTHWKIPIAVAIRFLDPTRNDGRCPPYGSSIARDLQRESVRTESGQDAPPTVYLFVSSEKNGGTGCAPYND